jgi:hypothetical protein
MDAGIADAINRRDAVLIAAHFDALDLPHYGGDPAQRWSDSPMAATLMGNSSDRAWLVGYMAEKIPGLHFDGAPADADWESLFSHLRAEILARRDPQAPFVRTAETPARDGVGSR